MGSAQSITRNKWNHLHYPTSGTTASTSDFGEEHESFRSQGKKTALNLEEATFNSQTIEVSPKNSRLNGATSPFKFSNRFFSPNKTKTSVLPVDIEGSNERSPNLQLDMDDVDQSVEVSDDDAVQEVQHRFNSKTRRRRKKKQSQAHRYSEFLRKREMLYRESVSSAASQGYSSAEEMRESFSSYSNSPSSVNSFLQPLNASAIPASNSSMGGSFGLMECALPSGSVLKHGGTLRFEDIERGDTGLNRRYGSDFERTVGTSAGGSCRSSSWSAAGKQLANRPRADTYRGMPSNRFNRRETPTAIAPSALEMEAAAQVLSMELGLGLEIKPDVGGYRHQMRRSSGARSLPTGVEGWNIGSDL